ncbi:PQQ-dependent sugar dehydrogenase [Rubrivirga sp. S365]|uniref:PQQ-dependent sugar dehydrogenase n=1 Tax=Rubrivirga sp. S365 TaxID=3076080 RepID=UPI0028C8A65F|nr:PQQ-dependent sugar dehydrogenase [Rubrivirga sp. S365]MDT7858057.1 PQQ-dependent sugar dehydrogenase [Rubrivirga sp. S365]
MRRLLSTLLLALLAVTSASAQPAVGLDLVADGFTHPLALAEPPDDTGRLFVVDQTGLIHIVTRDGQKLGTPFLDLRDQLVELNEGYDERGLLGLAFHPDYTENGHFYVFYSAPLRESAPDGFDHTNRLSEFHVMDGDPNRADPSSEVVFIEHDHPYMNHNAGTVAFGPDGMLYVAMGDGGLRDDQDEFFVQGRPEDWYDVNDGGNGQDIENNLLGSILRIDVDAEGGEGHHGSGQPYAVPQDNPFVDIPGVKGEIWAYGLRNPWRFAFDPDGGDLIAADLGQNLYDEVSVITKGGNYGWNVWEGAHCFNAANPVEPYEDCPTTTNGRHPVEGDPLVMPVIEAKNSGAFEDGLGVAIVGGCVYRGDALPFLRGRYLFGNYSRSMGEDGHQPGRVFVADRRGDDWPFEEVVFPSLPGGELDGLLLSFGQDLSGEVYLMVTTSPELGHASGSVYRMAPAE